MRSESIIKCFRKAGVLNNMLEVMSLDHPGTDGSVDPFAAIDHM